MALIRDDLSVQVEFVRTEIAEEDNIDTVHSHHPDKSFESVELDKLSQVKQHFASRHIQEIIFIQDGRNRLFNKAFELCIFCFRDIKGLGHGMNEFLFLLM